MPASCSASFSESSTHALAFTEEGPLPPKALHLSTAAPSSGGYVPWSEFNAHAWSKFNAQQHKRPFSIEQPAALGPHAAGSGRRSACQSADLGDSPAFDGGFFIMTWATRDPYRSVITRHEIARI
jgi:hypothetical protein